MRRRRTIRFGTNITRTFGAIALLYRTSRPLLDRRAIGNGTFNETRGFYRERTNPNIPGTRRLAEFNRNIGQFVGGRFIFGGRRHQ